MKKLGWKIWLLIVFLIFSLLAIFGFPPTFMQKGVLITSVETDSVAFEQGLNQGQIIISIDGNVMENLEAYSNYILEKFPVEEETKIIIQTKDGEYVLFSDKIPKITVSEIPKTNIKMGLDLAGGARALVQAQDKELTSDEVNDLAEVIETRLNVYGIADVDVMPISDLSGEHYVRIEIAGATPTDLEKLISEQGKFEAKIGNETVFVGGQENGVASVARSGQQSGVESCQESSDGGYYCNFRFAVYLKPEAAQNHADITGALGLDSENPGYLSEKLDLYVDDTLVDSLFISEGLKGRVATQISISGSGVGEDQDIAYANALENMKSLQTILITGSLPFKLEIVKLDIISPVLGNDFIKSILIAAFASLIAVALIIFVRYKNFKSSIALLITSISEIIIILGIASFIDWNLDLPSIAGILVTLGTGLDDLIIMLDESKQGTSISLKQRLKRAFTIILGAYFTTLVALFPLLWAGAGLLKGFAITTIIGISIGVFVTRPAFSEMIRKIGE